MSTTGQFRLAIPVQDVSPGAPSVSDPQVVNFTLETQEQLLLTVVEAAHRLGIGRTLMYQLLEAGEIPSIHIGRLHRVPLDALQDFVERRRRAARGDDRSSNTSATP